jgi:methionine-rich copper-binding protein CopC
MNGARWPTLILAMACCFAQPAMAHAFPDHAVPGAGATLKQAPAAVTIHFDSELEPLFSTLVVKDEQGVRVSQGKGQVDAHDPKTLSAKLTTQRKGSYHVYWSVVARDGHRTVGDYTFTVQ